MTLLPEWANHDISTGKASRIQKFPASYHVRNTIHLPEISRCFPEFFRQVEYVDTNRIRFIHHHLSFIVYATDVCLRYKLSNSMDQSPYWEANSHSASQKIPRILWNSEVHYRVHKGPPLIRILSYYNILPSTPRSSEWSLPFKFSNQNTVCIYHPSDACCMPLLSHSPWFDHSNNIWWSVQVMKLLIMQSSLASCFFLSLRSKYSPQHTVPKHPQFMFFP